MPPVAAASRRLRRGLVLGGLTAAALYAGLSWIAAGRLVAGHRRGVYPRPADVGLAATEVALVASDGVRLAAWLAEPTSPRGTVILLHGLGAYRDVRQMDVVVEHGYRALALDLRAHGESEGDACSFGWFERLDAEAAIAFCRARWPDEPLLAWGFSLGAAALVYAGEPARRLDGVVLEGLYHAIDAAFDDRLDLQVPRLLHPFAWLPKKLVEWRFGVSARELRPAARLGAFDPSRVLLATGALDARAGPAHLERLAAALPRVTAVVVPGADHRPLFAEPKHRERVFAFFAERSRG